MIEHATEKNPPSEAELLLPWYVSGKLNDADTSMVEQWLANEPDASAHLERAIEELDLTFTASESLPMPPREGLNRLMTAIGEEGIVRPRIGWAERIWEMLSPRYALAGAAALALVVIGQGAALTILSQQPADTATYSTATAGAEIGPEVTALVAFTPETSLAEVATLLDDLGLRIADGPKPGGIFRIAAPDGEDGQAALETLSADAHIRFFSAQGQ